MLSGNFIRGCVCRSVGSSVHLLVRPSLRPSVIHELKPCKSSIFDINYDQYERERILRRVPGLVTTNFELHRWTMILSFQSFEYLSRHAAELPEPVRRHGARDISGKGLRMSEQTVWQSPGKKEKLHPRCQIVYLRGHTEVSELVWEKMTCVTTRPHHLPVGSF